MNHHLQRICLCLLIASVAAAEIRVVEQRYISKKYQKQNASSASAPLRSTESPQHHESYLEEFEATFPPLQSEVVPAPRTQDQGTQTDLRPTGHVIRMVRASNSFGTLLTQHLMRDNENTVISPLSLAVGFGMLFVGAVGETKQELANVCQYTANGLLSDEEVLRAFYDITSLVAAKAGGFQLATARAIFVTDNYTVNPQYKNAMVNNFGAAVRAIDFAKNPARAANAINAWSKKATKGIFPTLVDGPVPPETQFLLLNAVYFKGFWEKPFSVRATFNSSFFNDGVERNKVKMMYQRGHYNTLDHERWDARFIEVPYEGGETAMIIALPNNFTGLDRLLHDIDVDQLLELLPTFKNISMDLYMPKFDVRMSYQLRQYLERMGLRKTFMSGAADFRGISGNKNLALSDVLHKARVLVDERGTEAVALTTLPLIPYSEYPVFNANHPFLFFMVHKPTNAVLFSGKILRL